MCRDHNISTCLDTCGYAVTNIFKKVLSFTDYVLYDIKHMDRECHQHFTGVANDLILNNAKVVAESGIPVLYRMPLIKDVNDSIDNIKRTAQFIKSLGKIENVELLPYHCLGKGKYQTLDRSYPGILFQTPSGKEMEAIKEVFEDNGILCSIGG